MQIATKTAILRPFIEIVNGHPRVHFHQGQTRALRSTKRTVAIIAGTRAGKTSTGPWWLHREMKARGPGDYLIAGPSYPILDKGAGPEIDHVFGQLLGLGTLRTNPFQFRFSDAGCKKLWGAIPKRRPRIIFGHADSPNSLQAMGAKAAWLDEAGQPEFKLDSYYAIRQRLAFDKGRMLVTTTPYTLTGFLKTLIWDPWDKAKRNHPDLDVFSFDSLMNPAFPRDEYERAMREMPAWKFDLFYRGKFTRPAGLVYDCFDELMNKCPRFSIPSEWKRYMGLDFGAINTAAVYFAEHPVTKVLYAYREYWHGGLLAKEHAEQMLKGELGLPTAAIGGSKSEDQWRAEFRSGGLPVREPDITEVELGINRVYGEFATGGLVIFDDLDHTLNDIMTYSRELDAMGEPTEKILDKNDFHLADCLRYGVGYLRGKPKRVWVR